ncbi:MAG: hypothetical protein O7E50_00570 [Gemmatimonadetes bacterium]|nr:hypothetical protein [Gemmatimonadota bacterium]
MKILQNSAGRRLLPLAVVLAFPPAAAAQPAKEILMTSLEEYERRMEGIENYTIVQETMGFETSITFVRTEVEGRTVFVPKGKEGASSAGMSTFYSMYPKIAERAELEGKALVDGEQCHVVVVDLSGLDLDQEMAMGDRGDFIPRKGKLYVDTDDHLIRKMEMEGEITADGKTRPMTAVTVLSDYREVEGMLHPFQVHITATGLSAGMSEEDAEEARKGLEEMERNLEGMDASQRAMVERMMGGQMEKLRKMLETGQFEITTITKEVRVNESLE